MDAGLLMLENTRCGPCHEGMNYGSDRNFLALCRWPCQRNLHYPSQRAQSRYRSRARDGTPTCPHIYVPFVLPAANNFKAAC